MKNEMLKTLAKMIKESSKDWMDDDWSDNVNNCCVTYGERYGLSDAKIEFLAENWEKLAE